MVIGSNAVVITYDKSISFVIGTEPNHNYTPGLLFFIYAIIECRTGSLPLKNESAPRALGKDLDNGVKWFLLWKATAFL